jgi:hypothetical protein
MSRGRLVARATTTALVALVVTGCAALTHGPSPPSPPLHRAPGGGYVSGDTTYHGSGGP